MTPQTVNKPQCLCVTDFVPTPERDSIQSLVTCVNNSIDRGQLKGSGIIDDRSSNRMNFYLLRVWRFG